MGSLQRGVQGHSSWDNHVLSTHGLKNKRHIGATPRIARGPLSGQEISSRLHLLGTETPGEVREGCPTAAVPLGPGGQGRDIYAVPETHHRRGSESHPRGPGRPSGHSPPGSRARPEHCVTPTPHFGAHTAALLKSLRTVFGAHSATSLQRPCLGCASDTDNRRTAAPIAWCCPSHLDSVHLPTQLSSCGSQGCPEDPPPALCHLPSVQRGINNLTPLREPGLKGEEGLGHPSRGPCVRAQWNGDAVCSPECWGRT